MLVYSSGYTASNGKGDLLTQMVTLSLRLMLVFLYLREEHVSDG